MFDHSQDVIGSEFDGPIDELIVEDMYGTLVREPNAKLAQAEKDR